MAKLVRDKIPDILKAKGIEVPPTSIVEGVAKLDALAYKIGEESGELASELFKHVQGEGDREAVVVEMADCLEVLHAIADHLDIDWGALQSFRKVRREERGGFDMGLWFED